MSRSLPVKRALALPLLVSLLAGFSTGNSYASSAKALPKKNAKSPVEASERYRLPKSAVPSVYDLRFEPNLEKFTFKGAESIKFHLDKPSSELALNALELKITNAKIVSEGGKEYPAKIVYDKDGQKALFKVGEVLAAGNYTFKCEFEGVLNDQLRGFYRAAYNDDAGKKHYLAATQMEPVDARRMFPAFDEPAFKAVFNIRAIIGKDHVAISNAPIQNEEISGEKKTVIFEPSPKMSTYLLALVVGDLKLSGETTGGNVPIRVWAVSGREHLGKYALDEARKIMDFETKYFGLPYLGKKLDLIALPEFSAGAMENIGAITYSDAELLVDEKTGSSFQRQSVFGTTAHEIAHQWFGDLVTMQWWDDLWLNEAFATWFTTKVEEGVHPEWRSMTESAFSRVGSMSTDSLKTTRAIHADVHNPAQAVEMFDGITYSKGASILKMLELYVGEDIFQKGIQNYLKKHSFGNASASDFWSAVAAQTNGVPVASIMKSFVFQPGYPQLNVKLLPDKKEAIISQYRQLRLGQDKNDKSLWQVPIVTRSLSKAGEDSGSTWLLNSRTQNFPLASQLSASDLFVNAGGRGYYRTAYEPAHLKKIQDSFSELKPEEKILLITDCSSLVLPGDVPVEDMYNFVKKIPLEKDPMILDQLVGFVQAPYRYVRDNPKLLPVYQAWARKVLLPLKSELGGWEQKAEDSQQRKSLRSQVLSLLGEQAQDKTTMAEAQAMFQKYVKDRSSVNPDLVNAMTSIVTFNGGAKEYAQFWNLFKTAKNPADEESALSALTDFHQIDLAKKSIQTAMGKEVNLQEGAQLLVGVARNHYTRDIGWTFIKQHWPEITKHFSENYLAYFSGLANAWDTPEKEQEFKAWYSKHPIPFGKAHVARSLESMHTAVLFRQRYQKRIENWLLKQGSI